jgi:FKBP-type peptidyl-prolyl cis-trans isomerase FkpA
MHPRFTAVVNLLLISLLIVVPACRNNKDNGTAVFKPGENDMADLNRFIVQKDRERIQNYIERKNLNMSESPTGLWYQVLKEGSGAKFTDRDKVIMEYECSLLDGTKCYSSESLGPRELVLGRSEMEAGLDEGLRMLRPGAEAVFILPPFLAYGLIGDGKKIPSRAVIVYNVNILPAE